jgi:hypothetical protein
MAIIGQRIASVDREMNPDPRTLRRNMRPSAAPTTENMELIYIDNPYASGIA